MRGHLLTAITAAAVLSGCGSGSATLSTRPTDVGSARELARLVADTAKCGSFEDLGQHPDHWMFTCQEGERTFDISAVRDAQARQAALTALSGATPVKAGDFFLVTETFTPGPTTAADLSAFPGRLLATP